MAELVIECPTPDGHIEFSNASAARGEPQTNSRIREFLKKHNNSSAADSGNSSDDQQRQVANRSPPPNCSICLGRVKSKCFTDSCMHQFCFSCLLEWSKVKPECPLCKQTFKSIIHNVTSMDSYEEYKVEAQQRHVNWINLPFQAPDVDMNLLFTATLPTTYQMDRSAILGRTSDIARRRLYQLFRHDSPLVQRFAQTYPDENYPQRISGTQWRQYIYNRRLYAEPLNDLSGQSRDISAAFYRANPAQMHRLLQWLHRELVCLNTDQPQPISYVVQRIETLIQTYDMTSFDFQSRIRSLVPTHTDHFIHELINYARSPYDLIGYDRFVTYLPRFESDTNEQEVVELLDSEEGSDVEFVGPVVQSVDITNDATNQNASTTANDARSNSSINGNDSVEQAGASTSGLSTTAVIASPPPSSLSSLSQTAEPAIPEPNLSADDSDDEEEIETYLRHKPNVSNEEVIRGRTGPTPPPPPSTASSSSTSVTNAESTPSNLNNNTERSDFDSQRTIIIAPQIVQTNDGPSTSQAAVAVPEIVPKLEPNTNTKSSSPSSAATETAAEPTPAAATQQEVIDADTDSDSDECLFVCAKKPPHLRTPEYVELNSDSDSDVVFVSSETCQTPMTEITNEFANAVNDESIRKSILDALTAHCSEPSTNLKKRKCGRNTATTDTTAATAYTSQTASSSVHGAKPSTSEDMLRWLIQTPDEHSQRISPRSKRITSPIRPRLTTTIKISRGKRIYESPSSEEESNRDETTDPDSSSTSSSNSCDSSDVESSSHEEYVCSSSRVRAKRPANNDGPSLTPRKKFRKRRGKRIYETTTSEDSDGDE